MDAAATVAGAPAQLGTAFALVCLAGACAPLGACVVLFMKQSHTPLLAGSLALAAGVMVFVSLTEVLLDSMEELQAAGWRPALQHLTAYVAFFGGVVLCRGLDMLADGLMRLVSKLTSRRCSHHQQRTLTEQQLSAIQAGGKDGSQKKPAAGACAAAAASSGDLEDGMLQTDLIPAAAVTVSADAGSVAASSDSGASDDVDSSSDPQEAHDRAIVAAVEQLAAEDGGCGHLIRTSILVWLGLSLHNIPEGLATIVGYMSSPHLGLSIAVAIAVHNIPEGIALGVPIFYATGSKWKAIGWAAASGLAEPLGALIGLALQLTGRLDPVAMGIIMAVVAGVMTGIAFQELLPRALSFDPHNKYTTHGVFAGMAIMAFSLVLLSLWDPSA